MRADSRSRHFICIHGHFYQPPRENPWSGRIDRQISAEPFHDWNERITSECYEPNTRARILRSDGEVEAYVNNFTRISYNFGPTLLRWMETAAPDTYRRIIEADRLSCRRFSGHGGAIAQVYHHSILPLANRRDKITEVHWGIRDFEHRFKRPPEGIWLAETAVDLETLEILADASIRFTILSPFQARRVRRPGEPTWTDVSDGSIEPRRAYRIQLPSGRPFTLFFYNGELAKGVAFQGLLTSGEHLAQILMGTLDAGPEAQLAHIATDGESYGHHHHFGEMALAYALREIRRSKDADLTVYGEFMELHPARWSVEILENTSWSCAHGIERWRSDCGCHTGALAGWNQSWRGPLRRSLNWLRDKAARLFEWESRGLLSDPWAARDDYVELLLNRSQAARRRFLSRWSARKRLRPDQKARILDLLEMQRYSLMMFTSCGWFFNDVAGIETIQILRYAGRLIELARVVCGVDLERPFLNRLAEAESNNPEEGTGRDIYLREIRKAHEEAEQSNGAAWGLWDP
jgi:alpha-amylase/alpha-mannosidase (GH57 family)